MRDALKLTRAELAGKNLAGVELVIAFDIALRKGALTSGEAWEARQVLELLATPAHFAAAAAAERYHRTKLDADGIAAVAATTRAGADLGFDQWLEQPGRKLSEVVGLIDRAIEKSKPGRDA